MGLRRYYAAPCVAGVAALLSGCTAGSGEPAVIDYHQVGLCDTFTTPGGVRPAKPNEAYVVYEIGTIDNTKRKADFNFFPGRLYVDRISAKQLAEWKTNVPSSLSKPIGTPDWLGPRNSRRFLANDAAFAKSMGARAAPPMTVPHATKMANDGYSIAVVSLPDEGEGFRADQTFYKLAYDRQEGDGEMIPADPPIVLNNTNPSQSAWPHSHDCRELVPVAQSS